jgi:transcriptional regulator with XRE-family HTH domain
MTPEPPPFHGHALRAARLGAGLSQTMLARIVGVTPATISNLERGRNPQSAETIHKLAQVLGVTYTTF